MGIWVNLCGHETQKHIKIGGFNKMEMKISKGSQQNGFANDSINNAFIGNFMLFLEMKTKDAGITIETKPYKILEMPQQLRADMLFVLFFLIIF